MTATLSGALGAALEWRLLTLFTITVLLTTTVEAFPAWRVLASVLDQSPRAKDIAQSFDLLAFADMGVAFYRSGPPLFGAIIVATLLGVFSWPLLSGIAIDAARAERPRTFAGLLEGGIGYYGRMLRIGLVAIVPLALVGCVAAMTYKGARYHAQHAILESQARVGSRAALAVTLLMFVLVHATLEAGRAAFGADDQLRSGWRAWLRGVRLTVRYPIPVFAAYLAPTLASYAIAVLLLIVRLRTSGPTVAALVFGFLLTQLAVAALGWGRAARLFAFTALARSHSPSSTTSAAAAEAVPSAMHAVASGQVVSRPGSA